MAKSIRSSVHKRNARKLRDTIYGPAVEARTERLSAKLLEIVAQGKSSSAIQAPAVTDHESESSNPTPLSHDDQMEEDLPVTTLKSKSAASASPIKKHAKRQKPRNSIVFSRRTARSKIMRVRKR